MRNNAEPFDMPFNEELIARLYASMNEQFGKEWTDLSKSQDRVMLTNDFLLANDEDGCSVTEYRRRIGAGNLQSYLNCLRLQSKRAGS